MTPKTPSSPQLDLLFDAQVSEEAAVSGSAPRRGRTRRTWLVHELVTEARDLIEAEFGDVWVEGEISNCRPASSGHIYFTLKDAEAQLPVVLFRRQAVLLRFRPEDGLQVRVRGKASVYEQRGQLQLVAETMEPVGAGSLQLAFEQLRDRLKAEGLFDAERKQPLPAFPRTVAVITSPSGAVIRDFLNIVRRRHSGLKVLVVPVAVQGDSAPAEIESALAAANLPGIADLIVLARGGGSLEDLAAFNSERVARAIAASNLTVVSAIGHETDFTIADFAADLRAPTPSAAAELVTEAQHKVEEVIAALSNRLARAARFQLLQAQQRLAHSSVGYAEQRVTTNLHRLQQRLDDLGFRLESGIAATLRRSRQTITELQTDIFRHDPRRHIGAARETLSISYSRLQQAMNRRLSLHRSACASIDGRLNSLSPLAVLQRGYALVQTTDGGLVRSLGQLEAGQDITTRIADGSFSSRVTTIDSNTKQLRTKKDRPTSR